MQCGFTGERTNMENNYTKPTDNKEFFTINDETVLFRKMFDLYCSDLYNPDLRSADFFSPVKYHPD